MRKWAVLLGVPVLFLAGVLGQCVFAVDWTIRDEGRVYRAVGFSRDPGKALAAAGVELEEAEAYTRQAQVITVHRAPSVTVLYQGQALSAAVSGQTAGELLTELGLTQWDRLNMPEDSVLEGGMVLQADRVLAREEQSSRRVPYASEVYYAPYLPLGDRQVLKAGRDGELLRREWVSYVNGQEESRTLLEERQVLAPRNEVVALGTGGVGRPQKARMPIVLENRLLLPTGEILRFRRTDTIRATAYTHTDLGCTSTTATGTRVHHGTAAVDPRYIPYGTRMFIMASDGSYIYGLAEAEDCGGDIKGDRIDLYLPTNAECMEFGRRRCTIYFLE